MRALDIALRDGTVTSIMNELNQGDGLIFQDNSNFEPIFTLTPAQRAILDLCYSPRSTSYGSTQSTRKKRDPPGTNVNLACPGVVGSVDYVLNAAGDPVMVVVDTPSVGDCAGPCGTGGTCCLDDFFVFLIGVILIPGTSTFEYTLANIKHCTCVA
ncbi:hypothetical protein BSL78_15458 [Apostichopus japonicus]|uniref:Uncharacterized protein n=1 Tax=Stichopus japonicus TaxID=307972 RepID=A0A2G8KI60_STIJA|nr:hypothetical protein BSL78_15458 [Apostichopus japonicus]